MQNNKSLSDKQTKKDSKNIVCNNRVIAFFDNIAASISGDFLKLFTPPNDVPLFELAMKENLLEPIVKKDGNLSKIYSKSRQGGTLSADFLLKLRQLLRLKINIRDQLFKNAGKICFNDFIGGRNHKNWQIFYALHCAESAFGLAPGLAPTPEEVEEGLGDAEKENALLEKYKDVIPLIKAYCSLACLETAIENSLDQWKKLQKSLAEKEISSPRDAEGFIKEWLLVRKELIMDAATTKKNLAAADSHLAPAETLRGLALVEEMEKNLQKLKETLLAQCREKAPKAIDTEYLLEVLEAIVPPFSDSDMLKAREEIESLADNRLEPENCILLETILPVIRGEKKITWDDITDDFPYSTSLVKNLFKGSYAIEEKKLAQDENTDSKAAHDDAEPKDAPRTEETDSAPEMTEDTLSGEEAESYEADETDEMEAANNDLENDPGDEEERAANEEEAQHSAHEFDEETYEAETGYFSDSDDSSDSDASQNGEEKSIDYQQFASEVLPAELRPRIVTPSEIVAKLPPNREDPGNNEGEREEEPEGTWEEEQEEAFETEEEDFSDSEEYVPFYKNVEISRSDMDEMGNLGGLGNKISGKKVGQSTPGESVNAAKDEDRAPDRMNHSLEAGIHEAISCSPPERAPVAEDAVEHCFKRLLDAGDTAACYWLAKSLGNQSPLPVWLCELLHLGTNMDIADEALHEKIHVLCDIAVQKLDALSDGQAMLVAAALIRPALLMPGRNMNTIFTALANRPGLTIPVFLEILGNFVSMETPLDESVLRGLTEKEIQENRFGLLQKKTALFQERMKSAKLSYAPVTQLRRTLFSDQGEYGKYFAHCMKGDDTGLGDMLAKFADRKEIQRHVKGMQSWARQKVLDDLKNYTDILTEWAKYFSDIKNRKRDTSYQEKIFKDLCGSYVFHKFPDDSEGNFLARQMANLQKHAYPAQAVPPDRSLALWPLRLVFSNMELNPPFTSGALCAAVEENLHKDGAAVAASLAIHICKGLFALTGEFFKYYGEYEQVAPSAVIFEQYAPSLNQVVPFSFSRLTEASKKVWDESFTEKLDDVKEYISECYFRGAIQYDQQSQANSEMSSIVGNFQHAMDKKPGIKLLENLHRQMETWDSAMLEEVNAKIARLYEQAEAYPKANMILDAIKAEVNSTHVYSVAWDKIARLEGNMGSNQSLLPMLDEVPQRKASMAVEFYEALSRGSIPIKTSDPQIWIAAQNLQKNRFDSAYIGIITELLRWFGFSLDLKERADTLYTTGAPNFWRLLRYNMYMSHSPLPQWGSRAGKKHVIALGWNCITAADIGNLMTSGYIHENMAVTVIVFCPLGKEERLKLLRLANGWPTFPLVIDSNLVHFLANLTDDTYKYKALFEIALAGSSCNPYTPDVAGAVPREMFFGRAKDREQILNPNGSCIIYGGRQLGKSALLQQIYNEDRGDANFKVLQHTMNKQETSLLDVILGMCIHEKIVGPNTKKNTFPNNLIAWLDEVEGRKLLVLLDECDNALDEDADRKFYDVEILRNLMQDSRRRFKVVITGLHSVQRFSHFPNSPLYHFGDPLCIGPLDTVAAYSLMTEPMAWLGIEFEHPRLVQMALNHCSYQPKLIQMFCSELVDTIKKNQDRGPHFVIDKASILKVYDSQNLKRRIKDCFTMTLDLDKRYLVIGYAMALQKDKDMTLSELREELRYFWPDAFNSRNCDPHILQSLLHEMEGLGLIISLGGTYRLRTPNIVELLGGKENVWQELEQFAEMPWQPNNSPDDLRISDADIFVASQYNLLADKSSRLYWVSGSSALGIDKAPEALGHMAQNLGKNSGMRVACGRIDGMNVSQAMASLSKIYERNSGAIAWISSEEFPFIKDFMETADEWLGKLRSDKKFIKIVCLISQDELYSFIAEGLRDKYSSYEIQLVPWSHAGLVDWCADNNVPHGNAQKIMNQTNGWYCLVGAAFSGKEFNASDILLENEILPSKHPLAIDIVRQLSALGSEPFEDEDLPDLVNWAQSMTETTFKNYITLLKSLFILRETGDKLYLDSAVVNLFEEGRL